MCEFRLSSTKRPHQNSIVPHTYGTQGGSGCAYQRQRSPCIATSVRTRRAADNLGASLAVSIVFVKINLTPEQTSDFRGEPYALQKRHLHRPLSLPLLMLEGHKIRRKCLPTTIKSGKPPWGGVPIGLGKEVASLPPPPRRTGRATRAAPSSSSPSIIPGR